VDLNQRPIRTIERNGPSKKSALAHDGGIIGPDGTAGINSISERRGMHAPIAETTLAVGAPLPRLMLSVLVPRFFGLFFLSWTSP